MKRPPPSTSLRVRDSLAANKRSLITLMSRTTCYVRTCQWETSSDVSHSIVEWEDNSLSQSAFRGERRAFFFDRWKRKSCRVEGEYSWIWCIVPRCHLRVLATRRSANVRREDIDSLNDILDLLESKATFSIYDQKKKINHNQPTHRHAIKLNMQMIDKSIRETKV